MGFDLILFMRIFAFFAMVAYFIFSYVESRRVKDEREEFIQLKSLEIVHRATLGTITLLTFAYVIWNQMPALVPIFAILLSSMYTEIIAKLYFRRVY